MPSVRAATRRTLADSFAAIRDRGIGLIPFVPAGYPDLATTAAVLEAIDGPRVAAIELGFPFSDPIADGPVIQQAFTAALTKKIKVSEILQMAKTISSRVSAPLVAMLSYSIVFRHGPEKFFSEARSAGFSGIIIPDLPPPEAEKTCRLIRAADLDTVLLVAPTTPTQRRREIVSLCSGFVYYLSVSGITGARDQIPPNLAENVRQLKEMTDRPIAVGFGISKSQHLASLAPFADAAIVGSAIVRQMTDSLPQGPQAVAHSVADFCRNLLSYPR
ncbi:MAG: tryptophan synthase subunit alpha [Tepidisphaeraceae bacterium]|jgi:tryptophan synthase alpha chain